MSAESTLSGVWQALVAAAPDAFALGEAATGRRWTRAELEQAATHWSEAVGAQLAGDAAGTKRPEPIAALRGQRVTFALGNGAEWLTTFLGLLRLRAVPVPLDPAEPVAAQRELARLARATWAWLDGRLERVGAPRRRGQAALTEVSPADGNAEPSADAVALVKLTSGSSGRPRAVAFTHAQMLADGRQVCASMGITAADVNFAVIPLGHSYGLGNLVVPLLAQGTPLVCGSVPLPQVLAAEVAQWRPTVFPAVPALLRALVASELPAGALAGLRLVISAGSPLTAELAQAFAGRFQLGPMSFYGSSETGGIAFDRTGEATLHGRSVGTPLSGVTLVPARGGRMRVCSAAVHGAETFLLADKLQVNNHGEVVLLGRLGRVRKVAGRRLDLGELETELRRLPGVQDALVAPHPDHPEELAAVLATALALPELRRLLRAQLAAWKVPKRLVVVDAFPLTARGKTDTRALLARLAQPPANR